MALNFKADAFKGVEIYERSQAVPKGFVGEAEIVQVIAKESSNPNKAACDYYIAEMKVTSTNMEKDFPIGTQISFFASTEFGMNTFLRNLLEFFSSVSGVKSSHPQWEQFKENASKMAEASLSSAQPLKGKKVRVHAEERENKKKEVKVYAKFSTAA